MTAEPARLVPLVRILHIYLTMFALLLLMFFGATGFMLNHPSWFGLDELHSSTVKGTLDRPISELPDKLAIVEELRAKLGAVGGLDSFEIESEQCRVIFKKPAGRTEVTLQRANGAFEALIESSGPMAKLTDLHKGAGTGSGWKWVIDGASILLLTASLTGIVLWTSLPRRRRIGLVSLILGILLCLGSYWLLVP